MRLPYPLYDSLSSSAYNPRCLPFDVNCHQYPYQGYSQNYLLAGQSTKNFCLKDVCVFAMTENSEKEENEFDVRLWLCEFRISKPALQKIAKNDVTDEECLLKLTPSDITDLKLGVGDQIRLCDRLDVLSASLQQSSQSTNAVNTESSASGDSAESRNSVQVGVIRR